MYTPHLWVPQLSLAFACVLGGVLFGCFLRPVLPERYLSADSRQVVNMGIGIVNTMAAIAQGRDRVKMPGRGHSLTIDARWGDVAEKALEFVKRFTTMRQDAIKQDDLGHT